MTDDGNNTVCLLVNELTFIEAWQSTFPTIFQELKGWESLMLLNQGSTQGE